MSGDLLDKNYYFTLRGKILPGGNILIPLLFINPGNEKVVEIECMIDTGATHIVLADDKIDQLGLLFTEKDLGTTIIADGKKVVGPVQHLIVKISNMEIARASPTMLTLFSRGAHSLIGMTFLSGIGAIIECHTGTVYIPKIWRGTNQALKDLVSIDLINQKMVKQKYFDKSSLRTLEQQREYIKKITDRKNMETGKEDFTTMLCLEVSNIIGYNMGSIGPVPDNLLEEDLLDNPISFLLDEKEIAEVDRVVAISIPSNKEIIGIDMGFS